MNAPVAVFAYRRAGHVRRALAALGRAEGAGDCDLHLFSDGPRDASAAQDVADVRRVLRTAGGFRSVSLIEQESNLGLARSITAGVSALLEAHGRVIVLEDDLEVAPAFLRFMNDALDRFAGEAEVRQVSAYMFPVRSPDSLPESFFLPLTTSWGWATWRRAWGAGPPAAAELLDRVRAHPRRRAFSLDGAYDYLGMLADAAEGRVDSWAIRWYAATWLDGGMVLYPRRSLLRNAGLDGSGTHHRGTATGFETALWDNPLAPRLPEAVSPCHEALAQVAECLRARRPPAWRRLVGVARARLRG